MCTGIVSGRTGYNAPVGPWPGSRQAKCLFRVLKNKHNLLSSTPNRGFSWLCIAYESLPLCAIPLLRGAPNTVWSEPIILYGITLCIWVYVIISVITVRNYMRSPMLFAPEKRFRPGAHAMFSTIISVQKKKCNKILPVPIPKGKGIEYELT